MTPKEKAIELRDKYNFTAFNVDENYKDFVFKMKVQAKHFALISVYEILKSKKYTASKIRGYVYSSNAIDIIINDLDYWSQVKKEIDKL